MSRVAEALQKAEQTEPNMTRLASDGGGGPVENLDIAAVAVPWEIQPQSGVESEEPVRPVARPAGAGFGMHDPHSAEFVELVQRVFRPLTGEPTARVVTFVSVGHAGARRPIALEVGRALAAHGVGSVCVVDASFGRAALGERAGIPVGPGLCDALLASRPATSLAVQLDRQLWLVPAGEEMSGGPKWLPEALARALRQLGARFDFVIVEAPPLEHAVYMSAVMMVAPLTDGVVLILEADRTRRDVASDVTRRLRASGVAVLGAVLTTRKTSESPEPGWRL